MSEDDQVRRLLADARHTEPIPPDVARRMDEVIADLRADRPVAATVTDLEAARRRRRARTLLVAAAAVVIVGIGFDQLRGGGSPMESSTAGADSGAGVAAEAPATGDRSDIPSPAQDYASARVVRLDPDRFARQVHQLQRLRRSTLTSAPQGGAAAYGNESSRCRKPGPGRTVPVVYDGAPGVLVYRPATGDTQVVDLILCGHAGIARSITLTAP